MNIDDKLNKLKTIRQVEAPPFLYTRIRQKISSLETGRAPLRWKIAFAAVMVMVLFLNISVLMSSVAAKKTPGIEGVVNALQLSSSNDLYHEQE